MSTRISGLILVFTLAWCSVSLSQNDAESEIERFYQLGFGGELEVNEIVVLRSGPQKNRTLLFLENDVVRKEVGISDEQWEQLKQEVEEMNAIFLKYSKAVEASTNPKEERRELETFVKEQPTRIEGILDTKQLERIKQISLRFKLRQTGLVKALIEGGFGRTLDISAQQRIAVFKRGRELSSSLAKKSTELKLEAFERLNQQLSVKNRRQVEEYLDENFLSPQGCKYGILVWQLSVKESKESAESMEKFRGLSAPNSFKIAIDGGFQPASSVLPTGDEIFLLLLRLVSHPEVERSIELVDYQKQQVTEALDHYHLESNKSDREFEQTIVSNSGLALEQLREQRKSLLRTLKNRFETILLPNQIQVLETFSKKIGVARHGLLDALVNGELGESLNVSDVEKEKLIAEAEKIRKKMSDESLEIEQEIYKSIFASLSKEQANSIRKLLGPPIESGCVNLDLMGAQLLCK